MQPFETSIPMLLYSTLDVVLPRFRVIFKDYGLTEQQWRVLRVLWEHGELSFGELRRQTLIPGPSLVGVVDRIVAMDLITRRRCDNDRRMVYVAITPAGKALESAVMPRVEAAHAALQESIDPVVWAGLMTGLSQLKMLGRDVERSSVAAHSRDHPVAANSQRDDS